jgi:hypothetical protein
MTMQGLGPRSMTPEPGKPSAAMTMQGLGPVVQRAMAAAKRPRTPQSIDDGWTDDEITKTPVPTPARRATRMEAQAAQSSQRLPVQAPAAQSSQRLPVQAPEQAAQSSQRLPVQAQPPQPPRRRHTTPAPRAMPVAAPFESGSVPSASLGRAPMGQGAEPAAAVEVGPSRAWFEQAHEQFEQGQAHEQIQHEEAWIGTLHVRSSRKSRVGKLIAPLVLLTAAGVFAGYFAFDWQGGKRAPKVAAVSAPVAAVEPAKAAAPVAAAQPAAVVAAEPAAASIPTPMPSKFVDVMLLSTPAGATVTLVDRGKTTFIGTTPIATALDPSRKYELVFSHPSQPAWIESIDPSTTRRVEVRLDRPGKAAKPAIRTSEAPRPRAETKLERALDVAAPDAPRAEKVVAEPAGEGILMISSKPPCEIVIDGKPTGLTTPQREIPLSAGGHKVTLVNKAEDINKTISVQISADKPTKVIQDLMK